MFCKNCGANLPDGTTFCGSCGAKQDAPAPAAAPAGGYVPQLNLNNFALGNVKGMRLVGVIIASIIALLSITKYMYTGMGEDTANFNFMKLFEDGDIGGEGISTGYTIFVYLMLFSNIVALAGCVGYLVFSFMGGTAANSPIAVQKCILCSTVVVAALGVGFIACMLCPSPVEGLELEFGYNFTGWLALILAAVGRLFVMPAVMKEAMGNR